jgi:hypothetical protein
MILIRGKKKKAIIRYSEKSGSMDGPLSPLLLPQGSDTCVPGMSHVPSQWAINWPYLSRWLLHPLSDCSNASPSPRKGTSTHETPLLCTSVDPARCSLSQHQSKQRLQHWGPLHIPAVCTLHEHLSYPSSHHRWCPRNPGEGSPLFQHSHCYCWPGGAAHSLRRENHVSGCDDTGNQMGFLDFWGPLNQEVSSTLF